MKPENVTCPECNGPMQPRTSQYGKFWGCRAYPKCKGTRDSDGEERYRPRERDWEPTESMPSDRQRTNDSRRWES